MNPTVAAAAGSLIGAAAASGSFALAGLSRMVQRRRERHELFTDLTAVVRSTPRRIDKAGNIISEEVPSLIESVREIRAELQPNHGSSLRDQINRITVRLDDMGADLTAVRVAQNTHLAVDHKRQIPAPRREKAT